MSEEIKKGIAALADDVLEAVAGGQSQNLMAAREVINGKYGNGEARVAALKKAGYDPATVQNLVNSLLKYEGVAKDVINGKYGNGDARIVALRKAGFDPAAVQNLVNNMLAGSPATKL